MDWTSYSNYYIEPDKTDPYEIRKNLDWKMNIIQKKASKSLQKRKTNLQRTQKKFQDIKKIFTVQKTIENNEMKTSYPHFGKIFNNKNKTATNFNNYFEIEKEQNNKYMNYFNKTNNKLSSNLNNTKFGNLKDSTDFKIPIGKFATDIKKNELSNDFRLRNLKKKNFPEIIDEIDFSKTASEFKNFTTGKVKINKEIKLTNNILLNSSRKNHISTGKNFSDIPIDILKDSNLEQGIKLDLKSINSNYPHKNLKNNQIELKNHDLKDLKQTSKNKVSNLSNRKINENNNRLNLNYSSEKQNTNQSNNSLKDNNDKKRSFRRLDIDSIINQPIKEEFDLKNKIPEYLFCLISEEDRIFDEYGQKYKEMHKGLELFKSLTKKKNKNLVQMDPIQKLLSKVYKSDQNFLYDIKVAKKQKNLDLDKYQKNLINTIGKILTKDSINKLTQNMKDLKFCANKIDNLQSKVFMKEFEEKEFEIITNLKKREEQLKKLRKVGKIHQVQPIPSIKYKRITKD